MSDDEFGSTPCNDEKASFLKGSNQYGAQAKQLGSSSFIFSQPIIIDELEDNYEQTQITNFNTNDFTRCEDEEEPELDSAGLSPLGKI